MIINHENYEAGLLGNYISYSGMGVNALICKRVSDISTLISAMVSDLSDPHIKSFRPCNSHENCPFAVMMFVFYATMGLKLICICFLNVPTNLLWAKLMKHLNMQKPASSSYMEWNRIY